MSGGGGAIGLVFADPPSGGATQGTRTLPNGAIYFQSALTCSVRNCGFWYHKGTAIRTNQTNICEIDNVKSQLCGDSSQSEDDPVFHFGDGTHNNGIWIKRLYSEGQFAPHVVAESVATVRLLDCYFEQSGLAGQSFCVAIAAARACEFNANTATPLVLTRDFVEVADCTFDSGSGLQLPFITSSGHNGHFSGLRFRQAHLDQVSAITLTGQFNRFNDILFLATGNFDLGVNNMATGLYFQSCITSDTHVLKLSSNSSVVNCNVVGAEANVSGILAAGITPRVIGCFVTSLSGTAAGIETANVGPIVMGNTVFGVGSGGEYKFAAGTNAWNNYPWQDALVYRNAAASGAISNTTSETDFDKSYSIDANRLRAGSVIRIRGQAFVTSATGGGTLELRLKIGSVVIQTTGAVGAGASFVGAFDSTLTVRTIGSSGTLVGTTTYGLGTNDVVTPKIGFLGSTSINTTIAQVVKMSAQWSVAHAGNSVRLDILAVEILSSGDVG